MNFEVNPLVNNAISSFGIADSCGLLFNLSEGQQAEAYQVSLAFYATLKNQESVLLTQMANVELTAKSPQETVAELSYYKGSIAQVRSLLTSIEQAYYSQSEQEN